MILRTPEKFSLPDAVGFVVKATKALRECYPNLGLKFTPDGKFVGDLGEAIAVEMFGVELKQGRGIDGYLGEIPIQIKTTGRPKGGAAFRPIDEFHPKKTHLIVYFIDWKNAEGELIFNGMEALVRPDCKGGQREVSRQKMLKTDTSGTELKIKEDFRNRYMIP